MTDVQAALAISRPVPDAVATGVDRETPSAPDKQDISREEQRRDAWQSIEDRLIHWGCDLSQLEEEGTQTPTRKRISIAIQLAGELARQGLPAPTRVVPDVHGGIVFEFQDKDDFSSIHVKPGGIIEQRVLNRHRLVHRSVWEMGTTDGE